jgi:hypothetical protein
MRKIAADFAQYAYQVVRHFRGRITYWQVWNEPDLVTFWHPTPNPDDYALLLDSASRAIKRANPAAKVVLAGLSGMDFPFLREVMVRTSAFDIIAIHPYRVLPETSLLEAARSLESFGKPVWFSEIGWPAGPGCAGCTGEPGQAQFLVRFYVLAAAAGVQRVFWYDLRDDAHHPQSPEAHYGLMRQDLSGKPAFAAYVYMAHILGHGRYVGADSLGTDDVYALRFATQAGPVAVLWNAGTDYRVGYVRWPSPNASVLSLDGVHQGTSESISGYASWSLPPESGPVYLVQRPSLAPVRAPGALLPLSPGGKTRVTHAGRSRVDRGAWAVNPIRTPPTGNPPVKPRQGRVRVRRTPTSTETLTLIPTSSPTVVPATATPTQTPTATSTATPTATVTVTTVATAFAVPGPSP